ncbi:hypothetical protein E1B28_000160 [Marasmius oreades]|uniref:Uncharacterized protein n=1 Tax=Marasmius oreades TaxID=181124 RepID=A0A9P7V0V5_9AGAR|nr:uncharacterized protein E1B28_000160 [Marasmius oreades]KAG7098192.1 hypothetical protein E1B28_000160 [Marasmius oreades]
MSELLKQTGDFTKSGDLEQLERSLRASEHFSFFSWIRCLLPARGVYFTLSTERCKEEWRKSCIQLLQPVVVEFMNEVAEKMASALDRKLPKMYTKPPHFDVAFAIIVAHSTITIHLRPILMEALESFLDRLEQTVDPIEKQKQHLHVVEKWANEVLRTTLSNLVRQMEYPNGDGSSDTKTQTQAVSNFRLGSAPSSQPQTPKAPTSFGTSPVLSGRGSGSVHSPTLDSTAASSSAGSLSTTVTDLLGSSRSGNFPSPSNAVANSVLLFETSGARPSSQEPSSADSQTLHSMVEAGSTAGSATSPSAASLPISDLSETSHSGNFPSQEPSSADSPTLHSTVEAGSSTSPPAGSLSISNLSEISHPGVHAPKRDLASQTNLGVSRPSVSRGRGRGSTVSPASLRVPSVDMSLIRNSFNDKERKGKEQAQDMHN